MSRLAVDHSPNRLDNLFAFCEHDGNLREISRTGTILLETSRVRIITRKRLRRFADQYPDSRNQLDAWSQVVEAANWKSLAELRKTYPHADVVGTKTVFNIKGSTYRLITSIHYDKNRIYIREILTHAEYDKGDWKNR